MGNIVALNGIGITIPSRKNSFMIGGGSFSVPRLSSDPLYYATLRIQNVVANSEYWVAQSSDLANVIAVDVAPGGDIVLQDVPAKEEAMLVTIRVRKGTSGSKYKPFETQAYLYRSGGISYIIQELDPIA